ncbi:cytochrome c oxidase subunit 3 [Dyella sp. KRB-257]|uniref:cytochrome c oxidase subunit 3 n=1 Tax=Dyella sp. KRB-257 TaxID=3400915 RepID=UPI003C10D042
MSELTVDRAGVVVGGEPAAVPYRPVAELGWDDRRGTRAMSFFIATEAMLFVALFFSYFYLGAGQPRWPIDEPPELKLALIMLGVLLSSSVVLWVGEQLGKRGHAAASRVLVAVTIALGGLFLFLQTLEYRHHLRKLMPQRDAYASIFYTITSVHALHVMTGLGMLLYVLALPAPEHTDRPPYRSLHNAGMYWHFVDAVWVVIIALLYVMPNLGARP